MKGILDGYNEKVISGSLDLEISPKSIIEISIL